MRIPRPLATLVARTLDRAGYSILPNWRLSGLPLATHLREMFARLSVDCVIDVGANDGGYAMFLRREVGFAGPILSFEPVSELADRCRALGRRDPLWRVYGYALGEREETAEINVARHSTLSSMLTPSRFGVSLFGGQIEPSRRETIEVRTLARMMPELRAAHGFQRPYLKIDTQGFDLAVMRGAGATLSSVSALQTELSLRSIYDGMPKWGDALDFLAARDFSVSGFFPVNLDKNFRAIELDCVLVNDAAASHAGC
jgi:FkbM family methyltransferase